MKKNIFYFIIPLICVLMIKFINTSTQSEEITISNSSDLVLTNSVPENIDFNFHIKPIISDKCFACHGPDEKERAANLRLDTEKGLYQLTEDLSSYVINKENPEKSELLRRIFHDNKSISMPPPESNLILTDHEKSILEKWVMQGAEWKKHWAYIKPSLPKIPQVKNKDWVSNPIDNFILKNIENNQLSISNIESKEILIRRLYFDLIGLPPSVQEVDDFINDKDEDSYLKLVDRLLDSKSYGERMASIWMDIARYGDSHGYQDDLERVMWPWRDWVIHAYNTNLSYDKFITWQIAGDLIPNATKEQIIATGFNRNHKITQEGGVIPEEYRSEYVADRTNTTSKVMMGLTMECARCHSHKYDDISHEEYYGMYSYFNNVDEDGLISYSDKAPKPNITVTRNDIEKDLGFINLPDSISEVTFMVMKETENLRKTYILNRGSYDSPTKEVKSMTPTAVLPIN